MHRYACCALAAVFAPLCAPPSEAQEILTAPRAYEEWQGEARLAGDLDGDGDVDLVRFEGYATQGVWLSFTVLLNDGSANFTEAGTMPLPSNCGQHVLLSDVDGDGRDDVLVSTLTTNALGSGLLFFAGLPGAAFATATHIPLGGNVTQLEAGNANGDAISDIGVLHFENSSNSYHLRWIPGAANRAFQPVAGLLLPLGGPFLSDAIVLDVSGDGIDDFAIAADATVEFHITQAAAPTLAGPIFPVVLDFDMQLRAGDLDADGDVDLFGLSTASFSTLVFTRIERLANGTWAKLADQRFSNTDSGVPSLGDWDGDGDDDLFLRGFRFAGGAYSLFRNDGTARFTRAFALGTQLSSPIGTVGCFDLNGDGHLDFADARAIYLGDGTFRSFLREGHATSFGLLDWEDDGDLDAPDFGGEVHLNDGRGVFETRTTAIPSVGVPNFFYGSEVAVRDFDGDGLNERLVPLFFSVFPRQNQFIEMRVLRESGNGPLVDAGAASASGDLIAFGAIATDADGDGDLDLVDGTDAWINDGTPFFTGSGLSFQSYRPSSAGDVDGDGDEDLLARYFGGSQSLALLRRTTPGSYNVEILYPPTTQTILQRPSLLADLDDDGDLDIVVDRTNGPRELTILANTGGTFSIATTISMPSFFQPFSSLISGDLDGDGRSDLVIGAQNRTYVLLRNGPGFTYAPPRAYATGAGSIPRDLADLDQDGDLDLVGRYTIVNRRFDGPGLGYTRQYGEGLVGSGARTPVLGGTGPLRVGVPTTLRLRQGLGGAPALLIFGAAETNLPNFAGIPGLTLYTTPLYGAFSLTLGGATGTVGAGTLDLPSLPPPGTGGVALFVQALLFDPGAASGISATNGVERSIGF